MYLTRTTHVTLFSYNYTQITVPSVSYIHVGKSYFEILRN